MVPVRSNADDAVVHQIADRMVSADPAAHGSGHPGNFFISTDNKGASTIFSKLIKGVHLMWDARQIKP
jgi:hypothetical protein